MAEQPVRSARMTWISAGFVAAVFLLLWVFAVLRLHEHYEGEAFLHRAGGMDTLFAVIAPLAAFARLLQAYKQTRTSQG